VLGSHPEPHMLGSAYPQLFLLPILLLLSSLKLLCLALDPENFRLHFSKSFIVLQFNTWFF
jgi:hypothetical protein